MFNAGLVKFHGQAYFRYNGQFRKDGTYEWNAPGGAILNIGDMEASHFPRDSMDIHQPV